jgi:hypothetical protein
MALAGVLFFFPVVFPTFKQHEWHGLDLGPLRPGSFCVLVLWRLLLFYGLELKAKG